MKVKSIAVIYTDILTLTVVFFQFSVRSLSDTLYMVHVMNGMITTLRDQVLLFVLDLQP